MRIAAGLATFMVVLIGTTVVSAYDVKTISHGGTVTGKVVYKGSPPAKKIIIPTKDSEACGRGVRHVEQIVISDEDHAVPHALVYLRQVANGKPWNRLPETPAIENKNCDFQPRLQVVPVGNVDIVNRDPVLHNTHGFLDRRTVFNVALPHQGVRVRTLLRTPGIVRVECDAHGWMLGWIYVADNPYYAITSKDGTFTLTEVPPGTYTLVAWHAYTGAVETSATVRANETTAVTVELKK